MLCTVNEDGDLLIALKKKRKKKRKKMEFYNSCKFNYLGCVF